MIYVRNGRGRLFSLKEIAVKYNVSLALVQGRYNNGIREIEELIKPKYYLHGEKITKC